MKKYEFTGETLKHSGTTLHRIRRISDGLLGGWIESEDNLDQEGDCFVFGNAKVYFSAMVYENAQIYDSAEVYFKASVCGDAQVFENTQVYGGARVSGNAKILDNAQVFDNARIFGNALIYDNAQVHNRAEVFGSARVFGNAQVRKSPLFTNAHKYLITMTETHVFVGCEGHTKKHWKQNIDKIAKKQKYSKKELKGLKMLLNAMLYQQKLNG